MTSTTVWNPVDNGFLSTGWKPEPGGWYQHAAGTPWFKVRLPGWWHRLIHRCSAHSAGVHGWTVTLRCICGGVRQGTTDPQSYQLTPDRQPLRVQLTDGWRERNSRYRRTAMLYHPQARPLDDEAAT